VGDAEKSNTLLNAVRLRYGDTPVVLQPTLVISGYQLQRNVSLGFEVFPTANPRKRQRIGTAAAEPHLYIPASFWCSIRTKFHAAPVARRSSAALVMGDLPIDVLFRLAVQSINWLSNTVALTQTGAAGSPDFFVLLRDLRHLQITSLLNVRLQHETGRTTSRSNSDPVVFIFLSPPHRIRLSLQ
jgi:hypothetical protein